jgi:acetolactate synthase-1/2/3 large subunit
MYRSVLRLSKPVHSVRKRNYVLIREEIIRQQISGAKAVFNGLLKNNVTDVFMYSGGAIMPLIDLFLDKITGKQIIRYYINNHEQNCGHAATAYGKSSGRTGVAIVTSGPGLTNMVTPILDATNDSTPLVVISGQVPLSAMGTNAFQECPATDITRPCTKWSYCAKEGDDLEYLVNEAFRVANFGKKGAVHIDLPKCRLAGNNGNNKVVFDGFNFINDNDYDYIELGNIIYNSEKPIVIVGKGCNEYPEELKKFIEKYDIFCTSTLHAVGTLNENHEKSLGFLGMHGFPAANHAVQNADLIIAIGSRFDDRTTGTLSKYAPKCKNIIHVNIEPSEIGKVIKDTPERKVYKVIQDCGDFLRKMNDILFRKYSIGDVNYYLKFKKDNKEFNTIIQYNNEFIQFSRSLWKKMIEEWKKQYPITYNRCRNSNGVIDDNLLNTQMVIEDINKKVDHDNTIVTTGVGNHQMMAAQFYRWTKPNSFITSGSLGVMGVGLPYAIGCQIANPKKKVIIIDGDGSFNHTSGDLMTVRKHNLPIKIFIMNDGKMSMVKAWETLFFNENYVATDCSFNPDYCKLAESFGIESIKIENVDDLCMIEDVLNYPGPILCDIKVQSDLCLPLVAPGKALDDIITLQNYKPMHLTGQAPS